MKQIWRHLRRARARWRLHRMEWAAMHRPLQPPPGYERFHTREAVFPGLRDQPKPAKDWAEFRERLRGAWRLYKHDYVPDPEITAREERRARQRQTKRERVAAKLAQKGERLVRTGLDKAEEAASGIAEGVRDQRPAVERLLKDRVAVLQEALTEFSEGYFEAVSGRRSFWGDYPYNESVVRKDNRPVAYEVVKGDSEDDT